MKKLFAVLGLCFCTSVSLYSQGAGYALQFDGVDDYVSIPSSASLSFGATSPMSVEAWVYRTGSQTIMHILGKRTFCTSSINYQLAFDHTGTGFEGASLSGVFPQINQWTHLAGTFD